MENRPYNIHDRRLVSKGISSWIRMINAQAEQKSKARGEAIVLNVIDEKKALLRAAKRYAKHCGNTSKYTPHQSERECMRRHQQMAAGQIGRKTYADMPFTVQKRCDDFVEHGVGTGVYITQQDYVDGYFDQ